MTKKKVNYAMREEGDKKEPYMAKLRKASREFVKEYAKAHKLTVSAAIDLIVYEHSQL